MTPGEEEQFENSTICWLCEETFSQVNGTEGTEGALRASQAELLQCKVRDHDHLTGKKQRSSS